MPRLKKTKKRNPQAVPSANSAYFDADIVQVICSFMNMEDYLPLQMVDTSFLKGVRQFCATIPYFRFTKHFFYLIETAGVKKEASLLQFSAQPPEIRPRSSTSNYIPKFTNSQSDRASMTIIHKQLRVLLSNLFVHAKSVYFSDVEITKSLMNDLMFDTRKPSVMEKNKDNRLDFKFTEMNVFETIEHISFVGCTFERSVMSFLASKLINLKSLLIFNSNELQYHEVYHWFNKKSKCKSLRFFYHDLIPIPEIIHEAKLTTEELEILTKKGHVLSADKKANQTSMLKWWATSKQDIQDMVESIPDHVIAIPIVCTCSYSLIEQKFQKYESALQEYMNLFGIFSNSFADRELRVQLCGGKIHKRRNNSVLPFHTTTAPSTTTQQVVLPPQLETINIDTMLNNVEFMLSNGLHLFDIPFDGYDFLQYAIFLHQNEPRLWNLFEKYHFRKLPDFNKLIIQPHLHEQVNTLLKGIIRLSVSTFYPVNMDNLIGFMQEIKEKKCYPRDFNDVLEDMLDHFPALIKPCVEKGLFNLNCSSLPLPAFYRPDEEDSKRAFEFLKEQHELERKTKKRKY
nr:unnamed protein product [Naegleria fowleri]